jgi:hypothetical protein
MFQSKYKSLEALSNLLLLRNRVLNEREFSVPQPPRPMPRSGNRNAKRSSLFNSANALIPTFATASATSKAAASWTPVLPRGKHGLSQPAPGEPPEPPIVGPVE